MPESQARQKGFRSVAGVDEAGRGPLAGPVVAAACVIAEGLFFPGINDSKKLPPHRRKLLFEQITHHPKVFFAVGCVDHLTIDRINIYQASLQAMREAVYQLKERPDYLLVDGVHLKLTDIVCERIVGGDGLSQMIAAASIIAKESRDQMMMEYHEEYPQYHFNENKGYGTPAHQAALSEYGPCPIHRRSFAPVSQLELSYGR